MDSAISLMLAVTDLAAVRAVTKAINANLPKDGPLGTSRPTYAQLSPRPRPHYTPTPTIEPRRVEQPTPNFASNYCTYDRFGKLCGGNRSGESVSRPESDGVLSDPIRSGGTLSARVFDAPWMHLPPVSHPEVQMKVNVVRPQVELITKGMLLDLFA